MNGKIRTYLEGIEATQTTIEGVQKVYDVACLMCEEEIKDAFITNIIADNGISEYINAWFFTENYVLEARNFLYNVDVDLLTLKDNMQYFRVKTEEFDFKNPVRSSHLLISFTTAKITGFGGELMAYGTNCIYLWDIYKNYLKKNLYTE